MIIRLIGTFFLTVLSGVQLFSDPAENRSSTYSKWLFQTDINAAQAFNFSHNLGLLHCNIYCNGSVQTSYVSRDCSTATPTCKPCHCDTSCQKYGDCCPDENGNVSMKRQTKYKCVSSKENSYYLWGLYSSYFMITSCPAGTELKVSSACEKSPEDVTPVTSVTSNVTYINEYFATCSNDTNYQAWTKEKICDQKQNMTNSRGDGQLSECYSYIYPPYDLPVRSCNSDFSGPNPEYIDTCNATGLWNGSTFDVNADAQCKDWHHYPVAGGGYVFKNIYCFLCNGLLPSVLTSPCTHIVLSGGFSLNHLVSMSTGSYKPQCREDEWYDEIKNVCRHVICRQGYELKNKYCVMSTVSLPNVQYHLTVEFWPLRQNQSHPQLQTWKDVSSMVVENVPELYAAYNITDCVFTLYNIASGVVGNSSAVEPSFGLSLMFRTNQSCCRDEYERKVSNLFHDSWIFQYNGSEHQFNMSESVIRSLEDGNSQTYKVISPDTIPEKVNTYTYLSEYTVQAKENIYLPFSYPKCSSVFLYVGEFRWNADGSISLSYADISIHQEDFTKPDKHRLVMCVNTLKELYRVNHPPPDPLNVVSWFFSILSLICLALTFITFCAFPSLLTLPTKNTMCLVVFLFVAQLLLQFENIASGDETICKVIGVLLHYFWLSVVFWMNVCSYHMFHVFVIDAGKPISIHSHRTRLLRYFLYANGSSLIIVVITIGANLGATPGRQIGYGSGNCYLSTALLTGIAFVLPLGLILIMNIIFFSVSVWTMVKTHKMSQTISQENSQVHIYMKLSTLTGIFWVLSILAENLHLQFLEYVSVALNASQGVFIFFSYMANRRIYQLWMGKFRLPRVTSSNTNGTLSTRL